MGIFEAAVAGGAGLLAYKKIQKSRIEKKYRMQDQQATQEQQPPHELNRDYSYHNLDKARDVNTSNSNNSSTSSTRNPSPDYFSNSNNPYRNGYSSGYQYQPQPLTFQPASEKFRGQHLRIDTENISGGYYPKPMYRARQELYLDGACLMNPAAAGSGSSLYRCSRPEMERYQSNFVEDLDEPVRSLEKEGAQCYYI